VARYLFKLMAYKDEYEVARLHADTGFLERVAAQFEGEAGKDFQFAYHLAPPLTATKNAKGELQKQRFGPWMLSAFRVLAGSGSCAARRSIPFGYAEERRTDRELVQEYRDCIEEILRALGPANLALAVEIARIPEMIRGFGHVKARHLAAARPKWDALMADWRAGPLRLRAGSATPVAGQRHRHRAAGAGQRLALRPDRPGRPAGVGRRRRHGRRDARLLPLQTVPSRCRSVAAAWAAAGAGPYSGRTGRHPPAPDGSMTPSPPAPDRPPSPLHRGHRPRQRRRRARPTALGNRVAGSASPRGAVALFHAYANWLVSISWKRFFVLAVLLVIAASILQQVPPFNLPMLAGSRIRNGWPSCRRCHLARPCRHGQARRAPCASRRRLARTRRDDLDRPGWRARHAGRRPGSRRADLRCVCGRAAMARLRGAASAGASAASSGEPAAPSIEIRVPPGATRRRPRGGRGSPRCGGRGDPRSAAGGDRSSARGRGRARAEARAP
jgi:hypothetical protein